MRLLQLFARITVNFLNELTAVKITRTNGLFGRCSRNTVLGKFLFLFVRH